MSIVFLTNQGSLSPFIPPEKRVSHFVNPIIFHKYEMNPDDVLRVQSSRFQSNSRMREFLLKKNSPYNDLKVVAKSYGVEEVYNLMMKDFNKYFGKFDSITFFSVDGWSLFGPKFGGKSYKNWWPNMSVYNFYQTNGSSRKKNGKYRGFIKGASFQTAMDYRVESTHMDIIKDKFLLQTLKENI